MLSRIYLALLLIPSAAFIGCSDSDSTNNAASSNGSTVSNGTASNGSTTVSNGTASNGSTTDGTSNGTTQPDCLPSRAVYDNMAGGMIEAHCGRCHGETPDFGAPYSLTLGYDDLIAGVEGERKVDRLVARMANKTMPPPGTLVPHIDLDTLTGWGSCGAVHPDESIGLLSSKPVWEAPDSPPAGSEPMDLLAPNFEVGTDVLDLYQCFTFELPEESGTRFIQRMEAVVDESRVLHHIIVLRDTEKTAPEGPHVCYSMPSGSDYLYAWAPGGGAIQFPDGGLRAEPGERFIVQIHYNNGAGIEDVRDNSGIRFHLGPPEGTEYGMIAPGPLAFEVPGNSTREVQSGCTIDQETQIIAGMPHMHEIGSEFYQTIVRADGSEEEIIALTGWSFEAQYFYDLPMTLYPGDRIITRCTFENPYETRVRSGEGTSDEMCFNFMFVTPPIDGRYCDESLTDGELTFTYAPGACLEDPAIDLEVVGGSASEAQRPDLMGGDLVDGHWALTNYSILIPGGIPIGQIDSEASEILSAGQIRVDGDKVSIDFAVALNIVLEDGLSFDTENQLGLSGTFTPGEAVGEASLESDCGGNVPLFWYQVDNDGITVAFPVNQGPIESVSLLTFKRTLD